MKPPSRLIAALVLCLPSANAYELHEWGTFTTVAGSDGQLLSGLQREEAPLPDFVHSHFGFENGQLQNPAEEQRFFDRHGTHGFVPVNSKGLGNRPVSGVTVKMETPVIYFHSDTAFRAKVKIAFEGGTISQWYPQRSGGETLPEPPAPANPSQHPTTFTEWTLDFSKPYRGGIEWDVNVLSPAESRASLTFKPGDTLNWLRARGPESNVVRTDSGETENYLFYRGVGNFSPGLQTTISPDETLHLKNQTGGDIPYLLVFQKDGDRVSWSARGTGLKVGETLDLPESSLTQVNAGFPLPVYESMKSGLTACGLLESEAAAMVQTWWSSYFQTEGLRVFWVLPATSTNRILPLTVTPPPEKIVRVLVGRSEVLRPRNESQWLLASHQTGMAASQWANIVGYDRFGLAIEERIKALGKSAPSK